MEPVNEAHENAFQITTSILTDTVLKIFKGENVDECCEQMYKWYLQLGNTQMRTVYQYEYMNKVDPQSVLVKKNGVWTVMLFSDPFVEFVEMACVNMVDFIIKTTLARHAGENDLVEQITRCFKTMTYPQKIDILRHFMAQSGTTSALST